MHHGRRHILQGDYVKDQRDSSENSNARLISVVIPLWNEAPSLPQLCQEIRSAVESLGSRYEIILVDDGSTDTSWSEVQRLSHANPSIRGLRLRRNFGKADALQAGFDASRGEIVLTIDADLQDDPADIPQLVKALAPGVDVVSGWKKDRKDPFSRRIASKVFNALVNATTGMRLRDHNCGLKCYRQEVVKDLAIYGELHRFIPVLAAARGFRITELPVNHRPRPFGRSKYGWKRVPRSLLDLLTVLFLTGFSRRPQHLLGGIGGCLLLASGFITVVMAIAWCLTRTIPGWKPIHLHDRAIFYYSLAGMLMGAQLLSLGLLAELFASMNHRQRPAYSLRDEVPNPVGSDAASNNLTRSTDA
jgi:glycosyltransferase involved in cell wall biosynthesis